MADANAKYFKVKICPSGHSLASLGWSSWCQTVTLRTDFSISTSHSWKILIIPLLPQSEISGLWPSFVAVQPGLCRIWSENRRQIFLRRSSLSIIVWFQNSPNSFCSSRSVRLHWRENSRTTIWQSSWYWTRQNYFCRYMFVILKILVLDCTHLISFDIL